MPPQPGKRPPGLRVTSESTLRYYGLTRADWLGMLKAQGWTCCICGRFPPSGRFVVDHEHVRGWKKMKAPRRRLYVRGVVCYMCNGKCVNRHMTLARARAVVRYFLCYNRRRPKD